MDTSQFEIILASGSPRRQAFFREMGLSFQVKVIPVEEDFPPELNGVQIAQHIVRQKALPFLNDVADNQLIITADTVVWHDQKLWENHKILIKQKNIECTFSFFS